MIYHFRFFSVQNVTVFCAQLTSDGLHSIISWAYSQCTAYANCRLKGKEKNPHFPVRNLLCSAHSSCQLVCTCFSQASVQSIQTPHGCTCTQPASQMITSSFGLIKQLYSTYSCQTSCIACNHLLSDEKKNQPKTTATKIKKTNKSKCSDNSKSSPKITKIMLLTSLRKSKYTPLHQSHKAYCA